MRKTIKIYLSSSIFLWLGTFIAMVANGGLYHNYILAGCAIFALFMVVFILQLNLRMKASGIDKQWFKTVDELEELKMEAEKEWNTAKGYNIIIGEHEAIKFYKENKKDNG